MRKAFWLFVLRKCLPYMYKALDHYSRKGDTQKCAEWRGLIVNAEKAIIHARS